MFPDLMRPLYKRNTSRSKEDLEVLKYITKLLPLVDVLFAF